MLGELLGDESEARLPPYLRILDGPQAGTLLNLGEPGARFVIGRGEDADLVLNHVDVSRAHLELVRDLDGTTARDLASKNGLEVNGRRLRERRLRHGDVIRLGGSDVIFQDPAEQALRVREREPDVTFTRTLPVAEPPPPEPTSEPEPAPESEHEPLDSPSELDAPRTPGDLMVYALATLVLGASLVGLVWLFK
jgi:pSer/pThr/pTyr-binding forkhead associated (FHA) protein